MAPTSALWEHPSESAASVSAALHKTVSRGADGETPWKRRSARIAAIRKRTRETSSRRPQAQGKPRSSSPCPEQRGPARRDADRLSPPPADTATAAEAAAARGARARHASLAHVMWRTLVLMHSNRLLALQVEALKRQTSAFVCSVLSNPENRARLPPSARHQHASS